MKPSRICIIITGFLIVFSLGGCIGSMQSRTVRKAEKAENRMHKKQLKKYQLKVAQHYRNQDDETRERMKSTKKMNRKIEKSRKGKTNIFDRLFH